MLLPFLDAGGPVMLVVLALWAVVLAGILERLAYAAGRAARRPVDAVRGLARAGRLVEARAALEEERVRAARGLGRIDSVSQLAPSVGLFGTVLGMAQSFFARGPDLGLAAPEVLAAGLAVALYTTIGGLVVFLVGQGFLVAWHEWEAFLERDLELPAAHAPAAGGGPS